MKDRVQSGAVESDELVAQRAQQGDRDSFGELIDRYQAKLLRYVRRMIFSESDPEDVVQEVFLKAYTNLKSYNPSRRFSPWIYRIAHNACVNLLRAKTRAPVVTLDPDTFFPSAAAAERPDRQIERSELEHELHSYLDHLDPKYRAPLQLYYFEDMNYDSIADVLHIPVSTVGVRLSRGRALLKALCQH